MLAHGVKGFLPRCSLGLVLGKNMQCKGMGPSNKERSQMPVHGLEHTSSWYDVE